MASYPASKVHFHEPYMSDHSLIEVSIADDIPFKPRPFKFVNAWIEHPQFNDILTSVWAENISGHPMFRLTRKLKSLKEHLKRFHRETFQPELRHSLSMEDDLLSLQKKILCSLATEDEINYEPELCRKVMKAKLLQESFLRQNQELLG